MEPSKYKSSGETLRAVEVAGCAAAEHQCAEYGDHIDCERAGRIALEIFKRLMLEIHNKSISIVQLSRMSHVSGPGLFHQETV
ncbi:MAG: hypothetical protein COA47_10385 [Robiginitomaculum sp.]|nr:MAG: hypothetical protein COA47_10385 [Robiginitomaculum sp.]